MKSKYSLLFKLIGNVTSWSIQNRFVFKVFNIIYEHSPYRLVKIMVKYIKLPDKENYWYIKLVNGRKVKTKICANDIKTAQFAVSYKWHSPSLNFTEKLINDYYNLNIPWIDVGSNLGLRSLLALSAKRPVFFIEPNSELNKVNIERCKLNDFNNFKLFELGASDRSGSIEFAIDKSSYNSSIETDLLPEESIDHREIIKIDTIDHIFQKLFDTIETAYIKVDVEGHELHVIEGAKTFIKLLSPTMIIEVNEKGNHFAEFVSIFKGFGYDIFEIGEFGKRVYFKKITDGLSLDRTSIINNDFLAIKDKRLLNSITRYAVN